MKRSPILLRAVASLSSAQSLRVGVAAVVIGRSTRLSTGVQLEETNS
jgi:hypothetical protein